MLTVIRPLNGIESNKYQPIIRQLADVKVTISPCLMSPLTRRIFFKHSQDRRGVLPYSANNNNNGAVDI
jgi:hypothetical protein